jgi:hypothetical protein
VARGTCWCFRCDAHTPFQLQTCPCPPSPVARGTSNLMPSASAPGLLLLPPLQPLRALQASPSKTCTCSQALHAAKCEVRPEISAYLSCQCFRIRTCSDVICNRITACSGSGCTKDTICFGTPPEIQNKTQHAICNQTHNWRCLCPLSRGAALQSRCSLGPWGGCSSLPTPLALAPACWI